MEEAWELAVVSAVGDLMTLLDVVEAKVLENPKLNPSAAFTHLAQFTGEDENLHDFVSKYMRAIDAAIDEVRDSPRLPHESKRVMVARLGEFRKLVSSGFSKSTIGEAFTLVSAHGGKDNLMLIYSAIVAEGAVKSFSKQDAAQHRDQLIRILENIVDSDIDAYVRQSIVSNIEQLIRIFSEYEIYGALDAQRKFKAVNSDLNVVKTTEDVGEDFELKVVQPLLAMVRKAYPYVKVSKDILLTASAAKGLLE